MIGYTAEALADIKRLHRRLLNASPAAAAKFLERLLAAERQIAAMPGSWPASANGDARRYLLRLGRSVYVVHYLERGTDQIVVRLWHGREDRG